MDDAIKFNETEIATVRKFLRWLADGGWLESRYSRGGGVTGADENGITVTEFSAVSDYDGYALETDESFIPWIALTDPEEHQRQVVAAEHERNREEEARRRAYEAQREADERRAYEALKAKFERQ